MRTILPLVCLAIFFLQFEFKKETKQQKAQRLSTRSIGISPCEFQ